MLDRQRIVDCIPEAPQTIRVRDLMRSLNVPRGSRSALKDLLEDLVAEGILRRAGNRRYAKVGDDTVCFGTLTMTRNGYGFVALENDQPDVFVSGKNIYPAMHRDRVAISMFTNTRGRTEGEVKDVIERGTHSFVGYVHQARHAQWITPRDERLPERIQLIGDATHGQLVAAEIVEWPERGRHRTTARVVRVFADEGRASKESEIIVYDLGLPMQFDEACLAEADRLEEPNLSLAGAERVDLTARAFFTVDPQSARDFDDAVYAEPDGRGGWLLSVAVADVAHFVAEGAHIDQAAHERGFSVYLPDRVLPMLPERLSADLCSLRPDVDRFAMVVDTHVSSEGELTLVGIMNAVIRSRKRLSYGRCAALLGLQGSAEADLEQALPEDVESAMHAVLDATRALRRRRKKSGYLELDVAEPVVRLGPSGDVEAIDIPKRHEAHLMVEEAMLAANVSVAQFFVSRGLGSLFRTHAHPPEKGLERFQKQVRALGLRIPFIESAGGLTAALKKLKHHKSAWLANMLLLRAMAKAEYSAAVEPHFGLGFDAYLHFTSPIRRYADLTVHRLVKVLLSAETIEPDELEELARHCSRRERLVLDAEREVIGLYKAIFMQSYLNEELEAIVSGVSKNGLFIHFPDVHCDGFIPINELREDWFDANDEQTQLVGRNTGNCYTLGDSILAEVVEVSVSKRRVTARSLGPR